MVFGIKPWQKASYGRIDVSSERSSSEVSDETLLGKEMPLTNFQDGRPWWRRYAPLMISHVIIFGLYSGVLYMVGNRARACMVHGPSLLTSPATKAIFYEERALTLESTIQDKGPYAHAPNPDVDASWSELLKNTNIEVPTEIMRKLGREDIGIKLPDREGYAGSLQVYHQIHCVKRLHQYMYPDYYFKDFDDHMKEMNRLHSEHCIDFLRQSMMCLGDIGLITFQWSPVSLIPIANSTTHQCINWEKFEEFTSEHAVDLYKPDYLIHPKFGPSYPSDGKTDKIGVADPKHPYKPKKNPQDKHSSGY
ncbi:hypothetical protein MMC25_008164 [Agyrium rufum]|nr:hypothetical protein [Agyrium rufum]